MPSGGKRKGAGRPKGAVNVRTRELTAKAAAGGIMPIDVMLEAMRALWADGRKEDAAKIAKDAAPYLHARLAAIEHSGADGGPIQVVTKGQRDAAVAAALRADA